jgi:hypothetical protein
MGIPKICCVCGKEIESPRSASQYEKWNKGICYSCDGDVANRKEELRFLRQAVDRKAQRETLRKPKNWRDCWTYPAVVPHAGGSRIASDIRQALDQFKTTSVEEFAAAFQEAIDHQDHHGMLDERERWIKGPPTVWSIASHQRSRPLLKNPASRAGKSFCIPTY